MAHPIHTVVVTYRENRSEVSSFVATIRLQGYLATPTCCPVDVRKSPGIYRGFVDGIDVSRVKPETARWQERSEAPSKLHEKLVVRYHIQARSG